MRLAFGFSRTNNLPSRLIRFFIKSPISHTYVRVYDKFFKVPLILHSDFGGVQIVLAEKFDIENIAIEEYIIDDFRMDDAVKSNLWHLGKGYSYVKLVNWAWAIILKRWFVRKMTDPSENPAKLICTDFILHILNASGLATIPIGSMNPAEFRQWCEDNHERLGWRKVVREKDEKTFFDHVRNILMGD